MPDHDHPPGCPACAEILARERATRTALEAAVRAEEDFFLTLSHELRGPLNAILSWVYLLQSGKLDEAATARALETIQRSANDEARLVGDMFEVSRIIAGKVRLELLPVDLAGIVNDSVEAVRPAMDSAEIRIDVESPHPIAPILADPSRLRQVMQNLLINAGKFTPKGGRITVRLAGGSDHATISVCDTGQGIHSEVLPHVFDRFRQGAASAPRLGGLGLGLSIVEHLVALHGGRVAAASKGEGAGATFTLTLPTKPPIPELLDVPVAPALQAWR